MRVRSMGAARAVVVGACLMVVAACTSSDLSGPVPVTAEAPFVCDGVPLAGLQRLTGVRDLTVEADTSGPWDEHFTCDVYDGDHLVVWVSHESTEGLGEGSPEDQIAQATGRSDALPIESQAPGAGYVQSRSNDETFARWVCPNGLRTDVTVYARGGAALEQALARYVISMLPWACGDQGAPTQTAAQNSPGLAAPPPVSATPTSEPTDSAVQAAILPATSVVALPTTVSTRLRG